MNMIRPEDQTTTPGEITRSPNRIVSFFLHFMLPLAALACGIAITIYLMKTSPDAQPRKRPPTATLVEVQSVQAATQQARIHGMGEVIAAQSIELRARVSGEILKISPEFLPGGRFNEGESILNIDPLDYTLVEKRLESESAQIESDIALEMGNQRIAEKEFILLNESVSTEERALILRKPQLAKLQATHAANEAQLAQARLNLERTEVKAPFNSVVETRNVDKGTRVMESTVMAKLVGTDTFWLRLTVPVKQLAWMQIPVNSSSTGATVKVYPRGDSEPDLFRTGHVIRLAASLEPQGRMAQLLVEVDDPLSLKPENHGKPRLLLGSYVQAEIEGNTINSAIAINRSNIHDGNTIWLMDKEGHLDIRTIQIAFRNRDQVIVDEGITDGERLIISPLASPIAGIPLRLAGEETPDQKDGMAGQRGKGKGKGAGGQKGAE